MKRTALNFIGRKLHSNKIKNYESKYLVIYNEDWSDKPWEDYAKDCFKLQTEIKENILNSTGKQRLEFVFGLQALYNIRAKELNYVEENVLSIPIAQLKYFFESEYKDILKNLKEKDLNTALKLYSEYGKITNSEEIKHNYMWKYVSACLIIFAIEEIFGNELNNIQRNIRRL
jgi:hypothetical protein